MAAKVVLGIVGVLLVVGMVQDGVIRYRATHDEGIVGTLTLERTVEISVGRPPPVESWSGTFRSEDGALLRAVRLAEELPGGDATGRPGDPVRVRWHPESPGEVFLADDSRAFRNWLEGATFLTCFFALLGVVVFIRRRRRGTER